MTDSFRLGPDGIYRCDAFQEFVWQKHGFGTRTGNPSADIMLKQIHSNRVLNANGLKEHDQTGDALITDDIGKSVGVRTADCVPILLLDSRRRAVGAVHAGWRGTADRIVSQAVEQMHLHFKTNPEDIYAAMGPCIRCCCYEVRSDVRERFSSIFPEWEGVSGAVNLDLPEANRRLMREAGVPESRIFDSGLCTTCVPEQFYSHRREPGIKDRMIAAICRLS